MSKFTHPQLTDVDRKQFADGSRLPNPAQRRELWLEAQKSKQQPKEEVKQEPEPTELTEAQAFKKLLQTLPREEVEKLIDEYSDDANFVTLAKEKIEPKQEQINLQELEKEYRERLAKIPNGQNYAIVELKKEFRDKGLKDLY